MMEQKYNLMEDCSIGLYNLIKIVLMPRDKYWHFFAKVNNCADDLVFVELIHILGVFIIQFLFKRIRVYPYEVEFFILAVPHVDFIARE